MQNHPRPDDKGNPVKIINPSQPTPLSAFDDPGEVAVVVPDGESPKALNGIGFSSWKDTPTNTAEWLQFDGQIKTNEKKMLSKPGKKLSAGVVTLEPDGRIWAVAPTNAFGLYEVTFPKGTIDQGMTPQSTAIREAFEESGLQVELTGLIGDFERSTSVTRYYFATRIGGNPADMGWESQSVLLIPKNKLHKLLTNDNDTPILAAIEKHDFLLQEPI